MYELIPIEQKKVLSWEDVLGEEVKKDYFLKLAKFIKQRRKEVNVYPNSTNLFRSLELVSFNDIKVVICGQDPYHGPGQANGLAFAVNENTEIPPSLRNIFKESGGSDKTLISWANQGVLLLNAIMTVEEGNAGSHANIGWETFTNKIIGQISTNLSGVVFLLWGNFARARKAYIDSERHLVLESSHPSPLSAHRGFLGCNHFQICNEYLKQAIDWR